MGTAPAAPGPVVIPLELGCLTAARIDKARGELAREDWIRAVIYAELALIAIRPRARPEPEPCTHPASRVFRDFCWACNRVVPPAAPTGEAGHAAAAYPS